MKRTAMLAVAFATIGMTGLTGTPVSAGGLTTCAGFHFCLIPHHQGFDYEEPEGDEPRMSRPEEPTITREPEDDVPEPPNDYDC